MKVKVKNMRKTLGVPDENRKKATRLFDAEEVEDYDYFNEGYPGDGYEDEFSEFSGWRDLVL